MTDREFRRLMMVYGADLRRWPVKRQAAAESWQAAHPEYGSALRQTAEMDRLLLDVAPMIDESRIDRLLQSVLRETQQRDVPDDVPLTHRPPRPALRQRRWASQSMLYLGLFILGCAANVAVRLLVAEAPLDLWFASSLSLPLGG